MGRFHLGTYIRVNGLIVGTGVAAYLLAADSIDRIKNSTSAYSTDLALGDVLKIHVSVVLRNVVILSALTFLTRNKPVIQPPSRTDNGTSALISNARGVEENVNVNVHASRSGNIKSYAFKSSIKKAVSPSKHVDNIESRMWSNVEMLLRMVFIGGISEVACILYQLPGASPIYLEGVIDGYRSSYNSTYIFDSLYRSALDAICFSALELYVLLSYKTFVEVAGHTGRVSRASSFPALPILVNYLGIDLHTEDHDLHHSHFNYNFSKRFVLWDKIFQTYYYSTSNSHTTQSTS
eukprot:CFRG4734T1